MKKINRRTFLSGIGSSQHFCVLTRLLLQKKHLSNSQDLQRFSKIDLELALQYRVTP